MNFFAGKSWGALTPAEHVVDLPMADGRPPFFVIREIGERDSPRRAPAFALATAWQAKHTKKKGCKEEENIRRFRR